MNTYVEHITVEGERWDLLAYDYYGDPHEYEKIIIANPLIPITPILKSGVKLRIPVGDKSRTLNPEILPPWKR